MDYKGTVVSNKKLIDGIFQLNVILDKDFDFIAGQFVNVFCENKILPRPFCIAEGEKRRLKLLIKEVGEGTRYLKGLKANDTLRVMGPLGTGFKVDEMKGKKVAMVGGGIGIASILPLKNVIFKEAKFYLGFNKEGYLMEELREKYPVKESYDSLGENIVDIFINDLEKEQFDFVYACGPNRMLKKLQDLLVERKIPGQISLEAKMACGVGGCLVCTCETVDGHKRICKEGPVFNLGEVRFND